ncbi:F-box/kelch-repeat protein [Raphanus sativus]|uniref:F-box protein At1g59680-like n=1 Tax=Raphanus sativus TaxID=3726 RepID=A0A6J0NUX2_RAPSA|nr:F-box protein At1g59680-like [Raphanus sativus]XP_056867156.1 F-box protein At1g59680-like [Raphanus sativus]KAJ4870016.1 F-box/kelch-repeat protein [Raphanus sativus]KAJ4897741.1 F-box/kelch-repeat protein [Raphanus sativus]
MVTAMSELPGDLIKEILSRVPLSSLRALRCTCKTWKALSKNHIVGKTDAGSTFLGFTVMDYMLCSMKLDLQGTRDDNGNLVYLPSVNRVWLLEQAEICEVFHWDGLLLCVIKDERRLLVWNPYLRQLKWIETRDKLHSSYMYGLGYENNNNNNNRNHKILRLFDVNKSPELGPLFEIYDFNSNSWRVLNVDPGNCIIKSGVSLKGNTYFLAMEIRLEGSVVVTGQYFLLCFDFTAERFGQHLVLPFGAGVGFTKTVVLSSVRDEQLAVLHQPEVSNVMEFWITSKIEPNAASWTRFLRKEKIPPSFVAESFFIDEEKKLALVSGFLNFYGKIYKRAYIIEEQRDIESVEEIRTAREPGNKLVFSSYAPSLVQVQINGRGKRKERDY